MESFLSTAQLSFDFASPFQWSNNAKAQKNKKRFWLRVTSDPVSSQHFTITFVTNLLTIPPPASTSGTSPATLASYSRRALQFYLKTRVVASYQATLKPAIVASLAPTDASSRAQLVPQDHNINNHVITRSHRISRPRPQRPTLPSPDCTTRLQQQQSPRPPPNSYLTTSRSTTTSSTAQTIPYASNNSSHFVPRPACPSRALHQQPHHHPPTPYLTIAASTFTSFPAQTVTHAFNSCMYFVLPLNRISRPQHQQL